MDKTEEKEIFEFEFYGKKQADEAIKMIKLGKSVAIKDMPYVFITDEDLKKESLEVQKYIENHYFTIEGINKFSRETDRCLICTRMSLEEVKKIIWMAKYINSSKLNKLIKN